MPKTGNTCPHCVNLALHPPRIKLWDSQRQVFTKPMFHVLYELFRRFDVNADEVLVGQIMCYRAVTQDNIHTGLSGILETLQAYDRQGVKLSCKSRTSIGHAACQLI